MSTQPTRITAQAAAELIGVNVNTLYDYAKRGVVPAKRVAGGSNRWIFIREDLEAWLRKPPSEG